MFLSKQRAFILMESIISLTVLTLGILSLVNTYFSYNKAIKKFSDKENFAYCLRIVAIARQKQADVPKNIILNNIKYKIRNEDQRITVTNLRNNHIQELTWNEK
ncbi:MAG: hypothetical protein ACRCZW_08580 [Lactobacillaceae bacterium]